MTEGAGAIRYLTDENFNGDIVAGLRRKYPEIDIESAVEANLLGLADPLVLAYAADTERLVLSHDARTMPRHLAEFLRTGRHSPGVLLIAQEAPIGPAIEYLALIWGASELEEWRDLATYLHV
jgi:hypothetical protein